MDSVKVDWGLLSQVSPFRNLRIIAYLQLPEAFRSLSRLSSALSAKASTLRSFLLNQVSIVPSVAPLVWTFLFSRVCLHTSSLNEYLWMNIILWLFSDVLYISFFAEINILRFLIRYSVFKVQAILSNCSHQLPDGSGLEKTRTSDLTLIRRAL